MAKILDDNTHAGVQTFQKANIYSVATSISAASSGNQTDATIVSKTWNEIGIAANHFSSVKLPLNPITGTLIAVRNATQYIIRVFPGFGNEINSLGADQAIELNPEVLPTFVGETFIFWAVSSSKWLVLPQMLINSVQIKQFQGNMSCISDFTVGGKFIAYGYFYQDDQIVIPFAGGGQANATLLSFGMSQINTVFSPGDSVKMRDNVFIGGVRLLVANNASNALAVFPAVGGKINSLGINTAYNLTAGTIKEFISLSNGIDWMTL